MICDSARLRDVFTGTIISVPMHTVNSVVIGSPHMMLMLIRYGAKWSPTHIQEDARPLTASFALGQNFPNPFNPTTRIWFELPVSDHVSLKIYDLLGREVATALNEVKTAGYHEVDFDASALAGGIYLYRLNTAAFTQVRKLVVLK